MRITLMLIFMGVAIGLQVLGNLNNEQTCKPSRTSIFWDPSKDEITFNIQRNFVLRIIHYVPDGTEIRVYTTYKTLRKIIDGVKDKTEIKKWKDIITRVTLRSTQHDMIPYKTLEEALSEYPKGDAPVAEEVFFVVDSNSKIDDELKAIEQLKKRKTFVVYYGTNQPSGFWKTLATDKHHLLNLNDNIDADMNSFLTLFCQDSLLFCNTNMYWTGDECKNCTHICSRTPAEDPQYCLDACPYFRNRDDTSENSGDNNAGPNRGLCCVGFVFMLALMTHCYGLNVSMTAIAGVYIMYMLSCLLYNQYQEMSSEQYGF